MPTFRRLVSSDFDEYQGLRLCGHELHPEAFAETVEEQASLTAEQFRKIVEPTKSGPQHFVLGVFEDQRMVGLIGFTQDWRRKLSHLGKIWGMFVVPERRGQGLGRALLLEIVREAKCIEELCELRLAVAVESVAAERLYHSVGFTSYALDRGALHIGEQPVDLQLMKLILSEVSV